jgi:hypothetical protein
LTIGTVIKRSTAALLIGCCLFGALGWWKWHSLLGVLAGVGIGTIYCAIVIFIIVMFRWRQNSN